LSQAVRNGCTADAPATCQEELASLPTLRFQTLEKTLFSAA